jgi:hypothetical protein
VKREWTEAELHEMHANLEDLKRESEHYAKHGWDEAND